MGSAKSSRCSYIPQGEPHKAKKVVEDGYNSSNNKRTSTIIYYGFLSECEFTQIGHREFVYNSLHKLLRGVLKSEKIYNSDLHQGRNIHEAIDNVKGVLLLV